MYRTGLAIEAARQISDLNGSKLIRRRFGDTKVTDVCISKTDALRSGKAEGRYITIEGGAQDDAVVVLVKKALEQLLPEDGLILLAGMGNPYVARDSLGPRTMRLLQRDSTRRSVAVMETDVSAKTGIDSVRMVRAVVRELDASCVLAVDALACRGPQYIGQTVQISDAGIQPGSGISEQSPALERDFVGVPVVAVGVPMVSVLSGITDDPTHRGYLVSPVNEDELADGWADIIARAINEMLMK